MRIVAVSTEVARIRNAVKAGHPDLKSSHLAEAFARGLGFGSNAAFLEWDRQRHRRDDAIVDLDVSTTVARLAELGGALSPTDLAAAIVACEGVADGEGLTKPWDEHTELESERSWRRRLTEAALGTLPVGKGARAGHIGVLMNWRVGSDYGMMDFVEAYCDPAGRQLHLRLAAAIERSSTLDPVVAKFLIDCLLTAHRSWKTGSPYPAWRDHAYWCYCLRILRFFTCVTKRGPLGDDAFEGPVPEVNPVGRWRLPSRTGIELTGAPSERPGPHDVGHGSIWDELLVGVVCMSLWHDGEDDAFIENVWKEALASPADVVGRLYDAIYVPEGERRRPPQLLDGIVESTTRLGIRIAVVTLEEAREVVRRAKGTGTRFKHIVDFYPERFLQATEEWEADFVWLQLEDDAEDELLEQIVDAGLRDITVMVSGLSESWNLQEISRLEQMACRAGVPFGASPSLAAKVENYGMCSMSFRARSPKPMPASDGPAP